MSELARMPVVRQGALVAAAVAALVLLVVFYAVVSGAVQRAAQRRLDAESVAMRAVDGARSASPVYFAPRRVSLARASD